MVVVRESPRAKASAQSNPTSWPPASPLQALLSSPSGRKRWQDRQNEASRRTPSPTPRRRAADRPQSNEMAQFSDEDSEANADEDNEDDEEVLKLKLARIEAQLKLNQLRKAKRKDGHNITQGDARKSDLRNPPVLKPTTSRATENQPNGVQVPLSPRKEFIQPQEQTSPARQRLGLKSIPTAADTSLKRARNGTKANGTGSQTTQTDGDRAGLKKPISFSERLSRSREVAEEQESKHQRITNVRSQCFSLAGQTDPNGGKRPDPNSNEGLERASRSLGNALRTAKPSSQHETTRAAPKGGLSGRGIFPGKTTKPHSEDTSAATGTDKGGESSEGFDPFSQIHLSKRHVPHIDVAREMKDKEIYTIPRLFKEVVSPHYDPPECESDFVVFAILASKSSPFDQKASRHTSDEHKPQEDANASRNKFMVLHLTDLKWELDCFLFGTGFDQFWKLTPGTLLAILNPSIMPPKTNQHNGRFSLKLGSSEDKVMEIGVARDLGFCVSVKKDGKQCEEWVDSRHTEICEFHLNLMIDRNRKHRMEVNSMWRGQPDKNNPYHTKSQQVYGMDSKKKNNASYNREHGQTYSIPAASMKSAAKLLDAEDTDALHNMSQQEASRKRIAAAQKERDLAKKLGEIGNSLGAEYLRSQHGLSAKTLDSDSEYKKLFDKPSAASLGLLDNKATDQELGPAKDRKRHFGVGAISSAGGQATGWGIAGKSGLLQPKNDRSEALEKGQTKLGPGKRPASNSLRDRSLSPKKRARFALEKGIREPGRESLGDDLHISQRASRDDDADDDDDLVII